MSPLIKVVELKTNMILVPGQGTYLELSYKDLKTLCKARDDGWDDISGTNESKEIFAYMRGRDSNAETE